MELPVREFETLQVELEAMLEATARTVYAADQMIEQIDDMGILPEKVFKKLVRCQEKTESLMESISERLSALKSAAPSNSFESLMGMREALEFNAELNTAVAALLESLELAATKASVLGGHPLTVFPRD